MAKPSIFSRDYEKKMRKRKRRFIALISIVFIAFGVLFFKFKIQDIDFSNMRDWLQAWVDTGKLEEETNDNVEEEILDEEPIVIPEKTYVELVLSDEMTVKAEYKDEEGQKKFIGIEPVDGITYNISPTGQLILITDSNQNMRVFNLDGVMNDITKTEYVSGAGTVFTKEQTLIDNPEYIWDSEAKFIDDNKIIYISQLPYFGSAAVNKYIWTFDMGSRIHEVRWDLVASDTTIGELDSEKGVSVMANGVNYFISSDGAVTQ